MNYMYRNRTFEWKRQELITLDGKTVSVGSVQERFLNCKIANCKQMHGNWYQTITWISSAFYEKLSRPKLQAGEKHCIVPRKEDIPGRDNISHPKPFKTYTWKTDKESLNIPETKFTLKLIELDQQLPARKETCINHLWHWENTTVQTQRPFFLSTKTCQDTVFTLS